jgi:hypothetical protein
MAKMEPLLPLTLRNSSVRMDLQVVRNEPVTSHCQWRLNKEQLTYISQDSRADAGGWR